MLVPPSIIGTAGPRGSVSRIYPLVEKCLQNSHRRKNRIEVYMKLWSRFCLDAKIFSGHDFFLSSMPKMIFSFEVCNVHFVIWFSVENRRDPCSLLVEIECTAALKSCLQKTQCTAISGSRRGISRPK